MGRRQGAQQDHTGFGLEQGLGTRLMPITRRGVGDEVLDTARPALGTQGLGDSRQIPEIGRRRTGKLLRREGQGQA
jgi:hypothetical protein